MTSPQRVILGKDFRFEASHVLPRHPGKCSRLHGHSWELRVEVIGPVDPETGFVCDFGDLKICVEQYVIQHLDHSHLGQYGAWHSAPEGYNYNINELQKFFAKPYLGWNFYPTSENLVIEIAGILQPLVRKLKGEPTLHVVEIRETCTSSARWINPAEAHCAANDALAGGGTRSY